MNARGERQAARRASAMPPSHSVAQPAMENLRQRIDVRLSLG